MSQVVMLCIVINAFKNLAISFSPKRKKGEQPLREVLALVLLVGELYTPVPEERFFPPARFND